MKLFVGVGEMANGIDHLQIALCLALQTTARLDAVEIAVDVELQQR